MDLTVDDRESQIGAAARQLFASVLDEERRRAIEDHQDVERLRKAMRGLGDGGWLVAPSDSLSLFDRLPFFLEAGAALVPGVCSNAIAASTLLQGHENLQLAIERADLLVSYVETDSGDEDDASFVPLALIPEPGSVRRLRGRVPLVEYGAVADVFLLVAENLETDSRAVVLVRGEQAGLERRARVAFGYDFRADLVVDVAVDDADVLCLEPRGAGSGAAQHLREVRSAIRLVECAGGARAVTKRTVEYVNTRHQFGKPLSHFQAVKQHAADMLILSEGASLLAAEALACVSSGALAPVELAWAKAFVPGAFKEVTLWAHQLHGGMGYARESDLFRWSERAKLRQLETDWSVDDAALVEVLRAPRPTGRA